MLKGRTKCKNTSNVVYPELTCQLFALTMHYDFCRNPNRSIPRSPSIVGGHQIEMGSRAAESNKNGKPGLEAVDASRKANTHNICYFGMQIEILGTSKSLPNPGTPDSTEIKHVGTLHAQVNCLFLVRWGRHLEFPAVQPANQRLRMCLCLKVSLFVHFCTMNTDPTSKKVGFSSEQRVKQNRHIWAM